MLRSCWLKLYLEASNLLLMQWLMDKAIALLLCAGSFCAALVVAVGALR